MAKFKSSKVASPANTAGILAALRDVRVSAAKAEIERLEALKTGTKVPAQDPAWTAGLTQDAVEIILGWEKTLRRMAQSLHDRLSGEETRRQTERTEISAIQAEVDRALVVGVRPDAPAVRAAQARMKDLRAAKFGRARKMHTDGEAISMHIRTGQTAGYTRCLTEEALNELTKLVEKSEKVFLGLQKPKKTPSSSSTEQLLSGATVSPVIDEDDWRLYHDTGREIRIVDTIMKPESTQFVYSLELKEEQEPAMAVALKESGLA